MQDIISFYQNVRAQVLTSVPNVAEFNWQQEVLTYQFSERDLLRETAWVILSSGFKEKTVKKIFNYISLCFFDWHSAKLILANIESCRSSALLRFNNPKKIEAIIALAKAIEQSGFEKYATQIQAQPKEVLMQIPFIGETTAYHLMKNLGFDVAKPDRHLVRIAARFGFNDVHKFCARISRHTGDPVAVVDLVLWRHAVT